VERNLIESGHNLAWEYTSKSVSSWGGMKMMKELMLKAGIIEKLKSMPFPYPRSNSGYKPEEIIESFFVCVWLGGARFAHTAIIRFDKVLREIFGWKRVASVSTYTRYFGKFTQEISDKIFPDFNGWFFGMIPMKKMTIDLDSSVVTRYGDQEGSVKGYNPAKKGRNSHHPIMAFISDIRMIANAWLRPGNTQSSSNIYNFMEETLRIIGKEKVGLVRGDSGFFGDKFLKYLEGSILNYIISVKTNPLIKNRILEIKSWVSIDEGIQISEFNHKAGVWEQERRIVVIRQSIIRKPKAMGKMLFKDLEYHKEYRYQLYVTNLDLAAKTIWDLYRQRADSENRIKELKYEFGMNGFCLDKFYATEAAFRMVLIAYNLISLFRQGILNHKIQETLSTIRFKCFAIGSWISRKGGKNVLKLSVVPNRRDWLDGLFAKLADFGPPFLPDSA